MAHPDTDTLAPGLAALIARAAELGGGAAPVELWNPPFCGPIPMRIAADGTWHYNGSPILRERMVRLFATVLAREEGRFVLVTPVEKLEIEVEDAPFQAVELAATDAGEGATLTVRTNVGDVVTVDAAHPLVVRGGEEFIPYVVVRRGLEARFSRAVAVELAELAAARDGVLGVWSAGTFFALGASA